MLEIYPKMVVHPMHKEKQLAAVEEEVEDLLATKGIDKLCRLNSNMILLCQKSYHVLFGIVLNLKVKTGMVGVFEM